MLFTMVLLAILQGQRPDYVLDLGWTYHGASESYDAMFFTRPGPRENMLWSRYERKTAVEGHRSWRELSEYNCATGQYRKVQDTAFPQPNMVGMPVSIDVSRDWLYPGPNTFAEAAYELVCAKS